MDRPISLEARRVDLTIELPFRLGRLRVDPPAHEYAIDGVAERMQPQTLKVLVALHDKLGQLVTRDELVDRCWDGRIVGEDVINRCISLLRRLAEPDNGFRIDTVPRAGYRLVETDWNEREPIPEVPALVAVASSRRKRIAAAVCAVALAALGGAGFIAYDRLDRAAPDGVTLRPFEVAGNAPLARTFAAGVSNDLEDALAATGVHVIDPHDRASNAAAFVVSGSAELEGPDLHLTAQLDDARDNAVIWSTAFTRSATQVQAMQEQVADNVARVLHCAIDTSRQPNGEELDRDTIKLYLKACALEQAVDPPSDQIQDLLQQVTARQPRFPEGWARLAFFSANAAFGASPRDRVVLRGQARRAAQSALRLNPRSALAHEALTELDLGHVPFAQIYREAQSNLKLDPNTDYVAADGGELLLRMGRVGEGLERSRRGVALDPFSPVETADLIIALIDNGRDAEASSTLQRALSIWPDDNNIRVKRLDYEARFGNPETALKILGNPHERPQNVRDVTLELYRQLAEARKAQDREQTRAFSAWLKREVALGQVGVDFAAPHLAQFGDVDDAFELAFAAPPDIINIDPEFLWEPESLALRRDPRFIALANKFHVADFWLSTGLWPDFCSAPGWPYNCRAEEARLRPGLRAKG
jgi:DNA-binding winged helix-turn-helix (wHTH) protein/TolB-like protein